jgi:hypothetical protein
MTPLAIAAIGAVSGSVAALALLPFVYASRALFPGPRHDRPRNPLAPGPILTEGRAIVPDLLAVTAVFVQKVATGLFATSLPPGRQRTLGVLWHFLYGAAWGGIFGLIVASVDWPIPAWLVGGAFGLLVWALGPAWAVPRMQLMLPLGRQTTLVSALVVGWHLLYGLVLSASFEWLAG